MQPRAILWPDGRNFSIEEIRSFRPAGGDRSLDCYTVVIHGKERRLFFERIPIHKPAASSKLFTLHSKLLSPASYLITLSRLFTYYL